MVLSLTTVGLVVGGYNNYTNTNSIVIILTDDVYLGSRYRQYRIGLMRMRILALK